MNEQTPELSAWHRDGCEKRWPHMIMAPRLTWGPEAAPIWRPRVDGDRPHICTCGLDDAVKAQLQAAEDRIARVQQAVSVERAATPPSFRGAVFPVLARIENALS